MTSMADLRDPDTPLPAPALDQLFREARTYAEWRDKPVNPETLQTLYDLLRLGPTSANCCPARFVFVATPAGKESLRPHLAKGNVDQTMSAPCTVIVAYDPRFYEKMPTLYRQADMKAYFSKDPDFTYENALRNGSLQGAYLILAARSLGLDCGPMSGFNNKTLDETFFAETGWKSNFLCNLGYGRKDSLTPRNTRLSFKEACRVA